MSMFSYMFGAPPAAELRLDILGDCDSASEEGDEDAGAPDSLNDSDEDDDDAGEDAGSEKGEKLIKQDAGPANGGG